MHVFTRAVSIALLAAPAGRLGAEELPEWPVHWMCAEADAIVAGERTGPTTVTVTEWLLRPLGGGPKAPLQVDILGLDQYTRVVGTDWVPDREAAEERRNLSSQKLVCFLERKGVGWYAMGSSREGSTGLVWIEEGTCYRYRQEMNPGGYILSKDPTCATEDALRREIAVGLADRREWEGVLKLRHPQEKAVVLASYLLLRTAPDGAHGTYRDRVRQELPELGEAAVRELIELLRNARAGDQLDAAVLVLNDLGLQAKAAVPLLLPLLKSPERVHPVRVLEALGRMGDATVAPEILPFLAHRELPVRAEAAKALAVFRYTDAAADVGRGLPEEIDGNDAYYVYAMLSALKDLDPRLAATLGANYLNRPEMKNVANLLESLIEE